MWRIKSALKRRRPDLFGGSVITGGVGGMEVARMGAPGRHRHSHVGWRGANGRATVAAGGAVLATAAALQADGRNEGAYLVRIPIRPTAGCAS